jgi:hypothetical protein
VVQASAFDVALEVELEINWTKLESCTQYGKRLSTDSILNVLYSVVSVFSDLLHSSA